MLRPPPLPPTALPEEDAGPATAVPAAAAPVAGVVAVEPLPPRAEEPAFVAPPPLPGVLPAALGLYPEALAPLLLLLLAPGLYPDAPPAGVDLAWVAE